jgi:hypothetical protein
MSGYGVHSQGLVSNSGGMEVIHGGVEFTHQPLST